MAAMKQFSTVYRASPSVKFPGEGTHPVFAPDGSWFAIGLGSDQIGFGIWDAETLAERLILPGNLRTVDLKISPNGRYLAALMDHFDPSGEAKASVLVLAGPDGILSRLELPHAGGRLAFSQDGEKLAVSSMSRNEKGAKFGGVAIYDVRDPGNLMVSLPLRELSRPDFARIQFSADGKSLYYTKQEADARVWRWDFESDQLVRTGIRLGPDEWRPLMINSVQIGSGGNFFVAGQWEFVTRWRDLGDRQERVWMDQVEGASAFRGLCLSGDNRFLAGGTSDSRVIVWDAESGRRLAELPHSEMVEQIRFCPGNPDLLASLTAIGTLMLWDWKSGQPLAEPVEGGERVLSIAFSPDGERLLVGRSGHARMWSTIPRRWEPWVVDVGSPVDAVDFTGHGTQFLATSQEAESAFLAEGFGGQILATWPHRGLYVHDRRESRFAALVNREAHYAVTADSTTSLRIRFLPPLPEKEALTIELGSDVTALASTRNGRYLAIGDAEHMARVFDLDPENGKPPVKVSEVKGLGLPDWELQDWRRRYPERDGRFDNLVKFVAFSPNTFRLVMVEYPFSAVSVWNSREGKRIGSRPMLIEDDIADIQVTRNNRLALAGGNSFTVQAVSLDSGNESGGRRLNRRPVTQLRVDRESQRLVTGSMDGEVRFWDLNDDRARSTGRFQPGTAPILSM
ncbi:MAG: WD40 repeat domain-containing protein, partial [Verrucomicrobiae bacterium]|nr:WD40 repeat domain-containing protein [Verrucomicrobiae bacterium]